ncbi:MAG TPA: hypothetical protein VI434_10780 [Candidatus Dormibacteraeota bacterium]
MTATATVRRARERGQTLMVFALAFSLFLFGLTCLVADSAYLYVWSGRVTAAAQLGAQSGADAVDPRFLYAHSLQVVDINPEDMQGTLYTFQRACIQAGDQSAQVPRDSADILVLKTPGDTQAPDGTACASDGCQVYAVVSRVVHLPIPLPGFPDTVTVRGTGYAAAVVGTDHATTVCTGITWVPAPPP